MAIDLKLEKYSLSSDCKTFTINDNTLVYSSTNNGYRAEIEVLNATTLLAHPIVLSFTVEGVTYTVTQGVEYNAISGNNAGTAALISAAIIAKTANIGSTVVGTKVYIYPATDAKVLKNVGIDDETKGLAIAEQFRDKQALKLFLQLMRSTGGETIAIPTYTATGISYTKTWDATISEDAWYEIYAVLVRYYVAGTWLENNIVYNVSDGKYYIVIVTSTTTVPTNTTDWAECTTVEQFELGNNVTTSVSDSIVICNSNKCLAKANALYVAMGGAKQGEEKLNYQRIRNFLEGASDNESLQNYSKAQLILEKVSIYCEKINCKCQ